MDEAQTQIGALAAEAIRLLIDAVDQSPVEGWDRPSNLAEWSLRELVGHATGSAAKIAVLIAGTEIWSGPSKPADWISDDPVAALRESAARIRASMPGADWDALRTAPEGEVPLHRALLFPVVDVAVHSWDVHRSQGRTVELPENLFLLCSGLVESVPETVLRRPGAFGPSVPAPEDATPTARLMAYLGRRVDGRD